MEYQGSSGLEQINLFKGVYIAWYPFQMFIWQPTLPKKYAVRPVVDKNQTWKR